MSRMRFLEVDGTGYEQSHQLGAIFAESIKSQLDQQQLDLQNDEVLSIFTEIKSRIQHHYPDYLEEINGKADGAGVDRDAYLLLSCGHLSGIKTACTSIMMKNRDGDILLAHNEDDLYTEDRYVIVKHATKHGYYCALEIDYTVPGSWYSWNSSGLFMCMNYVCEFAPRMNGIPSYFVLRDLLEAHSIEDILARSNKIVSAGALANGFHLNVLDKKQKRAISLEVSPEKVAVTEVESMNVHSNHYVNEKISANKLYVDEDSNSVFRLQRVTELIRSQISARATISKLDLISILQYRGTSYANSIRACHGDPSCTIATVVASTQDDHIFIKDHLSHQEHEIEWDTLRETDGTSVCTSKF